jgi:hypothetical protein
VLLGVLVGCGGRPTPGVVTPDKPTRAAPQGKDRGDIEIALGSVTAAVSATLVALGVYSAVRSVQLREYCAMEPQYIDEGPDPLYQSVCRDLVNPNPARAAGISSGLSFVFAVPVAVGSGFLLRKGIRMRREWKRVQGVSLRPWSPAGWRGAGLRLEFAF